MFSSVQSLDRLDRRGDIRDDSAEILFQSFLQEVIVSSSSMGKDVHFLMLSIQHFLCRRRRPPSEVPWRMVLERLSWRVTCTNYASFLLLTFARIKRLLWAHNGVEHAGSINAVNSVFSPYQSTCLSGTSRFRNQFKLSVFVFWGGGCCSFVCLFLHVVSLHKSTKTTWLDFILLDFLSCCNLRVKHFNRVLLW